MLAPDSTGSVQAGVPGLTFAYRFREEGTAERLDGVAATRALHEPGGWLWLHLDLTHPGIRDFVQNLTAIP